MLGIEIGVASCVCLVLDKELRDRVLWTLMSMNYAYTYVVVEFSGNYRYT